MHIVTFLDLDDTIFQTRPKCPRGTALHPAAVNRAGEYASFMTDRQKWFLDWLQESGTVIPVTARNLASYHRVQLPFSSFAVLSFGGLILDPHGDPVREWDARVRPTLKALQPRMQELTDGIQKYIDGQSLGATVRLLTNYDLPASLVAKHPQRDLTALARIEHEYLSTCDTDDFFVHFNDNNLSVVPKFLGKEKAVAYLKDKFFRDAMTIGVGDSLTDVPFMCGCDWLMTPRGSQAVLHLDR